MSILYAYYFHLYKSIYLYNASHRLVSCPPGTSNTRSRRGTPGLACRTLTSSSTHERCARTCSSCLLLCCCLFHHHAQISATAITLLSTCYPSELRQRMSL